MVVTCPGCHARFSLPEERLPGETARVRCSRCRLVFRINRQGEVIGEPAFPEGRFWEESPPPPEAPETLPPLPEEPASSPGPEISPPESEARPAAEPGPKKRWLPAALLAAVLLLGGALVGVWHWKRSPTPPTPEPRHAAQSTARPEPSQSARPQVLSPPPLPSSPAELKDLPVEWVERAYTGLVNAKAGQLLVIRGEVSNRGKVPRGPIKVKAILTDSRHRPLREETAYAGTTFTDAELRQLDPPEIQNWLTRPGGREQKLLLQPGERQAFTLVFFGAPDNLAETQSGFQILVVEGPAVGQR